MKFVYATGSRPLDGYTIKRGIGIGGFGEVYFATSDAGKEVALKRIQRNLDVEVRGVTQCINVKHPNLLSLYDIRYDDQGEGWIVMEYVAGDSLRDVLDRHPNGLPRQDVDAWFEGITAGVAHLHDHGIVHRDLKPGNIFSDVGIVKIGDYGLSKFISCSRRSGQTESVGTFHYMAPEIGKGVYGREIDVYALGILLFEMLTGNVPFEGESSQEIIMKHLTATPDLSGVPQPDREVIRRALLKDPDQRFRSVAEMRQAWGRPLPQAAGNAQSVGSRGGEVLRFPPVIPSPPASPEVLVITDEDSGIFLGPVRETGTSPFHAGVPIVTATAVSEEPLAGAARRTLNSVSRWWSDSAVSAPVKVLVLIGIALLLVFNAHWLVPAGIALGTLYLCYFGIRSLVLATSLAPEPAMAAAGAAGQRPPVASSSAARGPRAAVEQTRAEKEFRARHWHYVACQQLQRKSAGMKAAELSGSMLMAAIVVSVLCLVMMIVGGYRLNGDVSTWVRFTWLSLSSVLGAWLVLVLGKFWEGYKPEKMRRRFALLVAGLAFGALAYGSGSYLLVDSLHSEQLVHKVSVHRMPASMYAVDGTPLLPAYLAYFGGLLFLLPWWKQADPLRRTRLSLMAIGWCVLWAWILNMFIPFPQPWGLLMVAITSVAVQLSAPWLSGEQRSALRHSIRDE